MNRQNNYGTQTPLANSIYAPSGALKKFRILTPEAFWVFTGQAGTALAGLIGIKLLTSILDPSEFGRLAIANTIIAIIGTNCFGPVGQGLMRFWAIAKSRRNLDTFYAVSNRIAKILTLVIMLSTVILALFVSKIKNSYWTILVTLSLLVGAVAGLFGLRMGILTAARQRRSTAILNISNTFFKPLIATFLVLLTVSNAHAALVGYLLAGIFSLLLAEYFSTHAGHETLIYSLKSNARTALFSGLAKEILSYSWPFLAWGMFGWIHMSCDRWSLQIFHGSKVVGAFAVVSLIATYSLNFGSAFLTTLFSPIAFQHAGDLTHDGARNSAINILKIMTFAYIVGTAILTGFFALFHRSLIMVISNETFSQFSDLLPGLTAAWGLFFLGQVLVQFGLLSNRPQVYIMPKIVASVVAATTTLYFSMRIGPSGVVWGVGSAGFIYALWCAIIATRLMKNPVTNIGLKKGNAVDVSAI